ncbi:MAG: hypothetical protein ACI8PZ_005840 [Myxococcota bacterium]|jgi:uncharacterized membrane-anchored protein
MSQEVDELFGGEDAPKPRAALVLVLLVTGVVLSVAGLLCSAAPGGVLVLLAWMFIEKELDRVDSGYLAESDRPAVVRLRVVTLVGLLLVVAIFVVQGMLLCSTNVYENLLVAVLEWIANR